MLHAPIDNNTVVQFDPWRLLGIPGGAFLPAGFNKPVQFNLFDRVDPIIQRGHEDIALERAAWAQAAAAADAGQPPRRRQRRHNPNTHGSSTVFSSSSVRCWFI
ncbi:hypothetical protein PR003_g24081 [Phytophthora rubi]|uniref:Uncharacterized protein n=1 Tax=Phytophthora rubi TaxID=129364 RepID=A0A6A4CR98_9STRA|nr:hypothetical protein PR003_g24081 [Phytophthora rubi]